MTDIVHAIPDLKSEKLVSDKYRFIWVGVPKSATRSILTLLYREPPMDFGARQVNEELRFILQADPRVRDYFKFTFVRNPWSRVVSTYQNKIKTTREKVKLMFAERYPGLRDGMGFEEFVHFLVEHPQGSDSHADRHWASQHLFLIDEKGQVLVDYIGKVENLEDDFRKITRQLGLGSLELPVLNTRDGWTGDTASLKQRDPHDYRTWYNEETRELVRQRYAVDIDFFKYEF